MRELFKVFMSSEKMKSQWYDDPEAGLQEVKDLFKDLFWDVDITDCKRDIQHVEESEEYEEWTNFVLYGSL